MYTCSGVCACVCMRVFYWTDMLCIQVPASGKHTAKAMAPGSKCMWLQEYGMGDSTLSECGLSSV